MRGDLLAFVLLRGAQQFRIDPSWRKSGGFQNRACFGFPIARALKKTNFVENSGCEALLRPYFNLILMERLFIFEILFHNSTN